MSTATENTNTRPAPAARQLQRPGPDASSVDAAAALARGEEIEDIDLARIIGATVTVEGEHRAAV